MSQQILVLFQNETELEATFEELKNISTTRFAIKDDTDKLPYTDASFDQVYFVSPSKATHTDALLTEAARVLKGDGNIRFRETIGEGLRSQSDLEDAVMFAGFVNTTITVDNNIADVKASKPSWEKKAFSLSTRTEVEGKKVEPTKPKNANVWTIGGDDDDSAEYEDEDNLLQAEDLTPAKTYSSDGAKPVKKACKNCTCGFAEKQACATSDSNNTTEVNTCKPLTIDDVAKEEALPKSSCGSCYLGDAYRCASCPYLGMPAFKPGEKIQLSGNLLHSDI
eukprot:GEZU01042320.1.p2 GENE.GEZU01042320.1~~GEZU01042320.1.p2  ORF type:complete len:280 (-),score=87.10 GEZU01042320.1:127-966(-)